jgi:hypothetical protein
MISIFNVKTETKEGLFYSEYNLTREFDKLNKFSDDSITIFPKANMDEDLAYDFDLKSASLLPGIPDDISKELWYNNIKLCEDTEINKELFLSILIKMLPCIYDYSRETVEPVTEFSVYYNYYKKISSFTQIWNLFNNIYKNEIKNKLIVLGPGNFMEQCIPQFLINDILTNDKIYDIYLIDHCDEGFGCPSIDEIISYLKYKLGSNYDTKIRNFKINHLRLAIDLYALCYTIYCLNTPDIKTIIYDTIHTGSKGVSIVNNYNSIFKYLQKITDSNFINSLESKNIIIYMGTGHKFIFFNNTDKIFKLEKIDKLRNCKYRITDKNVDKGCPLSEFPLECIINNNFDYFDFTPYQTIAASAGGYFNKYLKYKAKYLKLKSTLAK